MQFELIIKKLKNQLLPEEEVIFMEWYNSDVRHREYFKKFKNNYSENFKPVDSKKAWLLVNQRLNLKKPKPYRKMAIAASFVGLLGLLSFFNIRNNSKEAAVESVITISIVDKSNERAILTLANGTDVILTEEGYQNKNIKSNGSELIYESASTNSSKDDIIYNYLSVPRGGEFFIQLSDGTKVWLNAESKLKFPVEFKGSSREVELVYGEAYFEVSPSTFHEGVNFIVKTQNQIIEVLGTEFNLSAYKDDKTIITTLVEGKVSLAHSDLSDVKSLSPSQQATFDLQTNTVNIERVDTDDITAWRLGVLRFQDKSLKDIMIALSRWYDLEVSFESETIQRQKFNGIFRKTQNIENILESIQKTQEATFQIDGKKIFVKKSK